MALNGFGSRYGRVRDASQDPELAAELAEAVRGAQRRYVVARVGGLPAGPMGDRGLAGTATVGAGAACD